MYAHFGVTHLAIYLSFRSKGSHGIHYDNIHGSRAYQPIYDFKGLLPVIRLGDNQVIHIYPYFLGITGVKGMFRIYKSGRATQLLCLGNGMQCKGSLT